MLTQTNKTLCIDKNDKVEKVIARRVGIETKRRKKKGRRGMQSGTRENSSFGKTFSWVLPGGSWLPLISGCSNPERIIRTRLFSNTAPSQNPNRHLRQAILIIRRG
jgi:hypothetical protein